MSDTHPAQAGEVMQIPFDLWRGWVFGETGSLWRKPENTNTTSWTTFIRCLLPHQEALSDSGAVNAPALFLGAAAIPACIFTYINHPGACDTENEVDHRFPQLEEKNKLDSDYLKQWSPTAAGCSGPHKHLQRGSKWSLATSLSPCADQTRICHLTKMWAAPPHGRFAFLIPAALMQHLGGWYFSLEIISSIRATHEKLSLPYSPARKKQKHLTKKSWVTPKGKIEELKKNMWREWRDDKINWPCFWICHRNKKYASTSTAENLRGCWNSGKTKRTQ